MTWISVGTEAGPGELVVPGDLWAGPGGEVVLRYGSLDARAHVRVVPAAGQARTGDAQVRALHFGPDLVERLAIRREPVYQLRAADGAVEIGPVLGLLLGEHSHVYDDEYLRTRTGRVAAVYSRSGGLYSAFSARNVSLAQGCAYGLFFDPAGMRWNYGRLPIPAAVYRRSFLHPQRLVDKIRKFPRLHLFNSRRFDKWELYGIFRRDWFLRRYLPETQLAADGAQVRALADRYGGAVLKPRDLSRGRGVLFLEPDRAGYTLVRHHTQGKPVRQSLTAAEVDEVVSRCLAGRGYLCQPRLRLATVAGEPFDVRVVMQRAHTGAWRCTGIECRVAGEGRLLTNISAGGSAMWLSDAVERAFGGEISPAGVERRLSALGRRVCAALDATGEEFAEFGLDFALDRMGQIWLIEANVLPTFYGFKALDSDIHHHLLTAPLEYACRLTGFRLLPLGEPVPALAPPQETARAGERLSSPLGRDLAVRVIYAPSLMLGGRPTAAAGQGTVGHVPKP